MILAVNHHFGLIIFWGPKLPVFSTPKPLGMYFSSINPGYLSQHMQSQANTRVAHKNTYMKHYHMCIYIYVYSYIEMTI